MMGAADASAALFRSRVVARGLLYAAQVLGLVVLLRALAEFPWVAAAAPSILRVAAFLLTPQRLGFIFANGIVIGLAILFTRDAASFWPTTFADACGSPSSNSNGDAPVQHPFLNFLDASRTTQQTTEAEPGGEEVFEDKHAVHVKTKTKVRAQPPRRTVSEKTTGGGAAERTATATATATAKELRRAKSENGKRRQRRAAAAAPAAAPAPAPAELVTDDEAFRLLIEAFIAKQQTLFREESLIVPGAGGEDGPALAGAAAAVAVK